MDSFVDTEMPVILSDGFGNSMAFYKERDHVYSVHFNMKDTGKIARDTAREMLSEMFQDDAEMIMGYILDDNRKAKWMARQIGGTSYGSLDSVHGSGELFILTKTEWKDKEWAH
jgi:hypothetical protein